MRILQFNNTIVLLLLLHLGATHLEAQENLTLEQCLQRVQEFNPDTRQLAVADRVGAEQQKLNSLGYYPQLSLNGKATWQSDVTSVGIDMPGFDIPSPDKDQYAVTLDVNQYIYDGGYTQARRKVIEHETALSMLQYNTDIQMTIGQTIDVFYQAILQRQLIQSAELQIARLDRVIQRLNDNYEAGTVDKGDVLSAKVRRAEMIQKRQEASDNEHKLRAMLALLMGQDDTEFIPVESDAPAMVQATDFSTRADMRLLDTRVYVLDANDKLNRAQYNPRISAFASLGYGKPGLNFLSDQFDTYATAGLSLHIPLSQAYTRKSSQESQLIQMQKESVKLSQEKLLRDLHVKEAQHLADINKYNTWLEDDREILSMRAQLVEVAQARYDAGTIAITDFLDELTDLSLAEEQEVNHSIMLQREHALLKQLYGSQIQ